MPVKYAPSASGMSALKSEGMHAKVKSTASMGTLCRRA
jgi:hypothetical protein